MADNFGLKIGVEAKKNSKTLCAISISRLRYSAPKHLERQGIPSPAGKETWQTAVVRSILKNEKYKGHALLQKTYCADFLTKKMVKNTGQVQQYYVENSHPAIIEPDEFDAVQLEIERRKSLGRLTSIFA
ncbi:MAG: recombinase family protein [Sphaerochaetaceae bacterium]